MPIARSVFWRAQWTPYLSIASFGAVADGVTNNIAAINNTLAQAKLKGATAVVPPGTWAYSGVINNTGVPFIGAGDASILYALDTANETIMCTGNGAQVRSMQLAGVTPPARLSTLQCSRVTINGGTNFLVDSLLIVTSAGAGVMDFGGSNGTISNNRISNTKADSIHNTFGASFITITGNTISNSGDDGVSVVSYQGDGVLCHDITARNNSVSDNVGGRGMTVVGGQTVLYERNTITNSGTKAGILVAQESSFHSFGCTGITVQFNTLTNCGSTATGHAAIFVNDSNEFPNTTIRATRNDIIQTPGAGQFGLRVDNGQNVDIVFDQNRVSGTTAGNVALNQCTPPATVNPYVSGPVGAGA